MTQKTGFRLVFQINRKMVNTIWYRLIQPEIEIDLSVSVSLYYSPALFDLSNIRSLFCSHVLLLTGTIHLFYYLLTLSIRFIIQSLHYSEEANYYLLLFAGSIICLLYSLVLLFDRSIISLFYSLALFARSINRSLFFWAKQELSGSAFNWTAGLEKKLASLAERLCLSA